MRVGVRVVALAAAVAALGLGAAAAAPSATAPRWIVFSAKPDGFGVQQLFRIQTDGTGIQQITTGDQPVSQPSFSPDGTRIVFNRLGVGLFRANVDGTAVHQLTRGARDSYPVWSPDGKHIAFIRVYASQWRLYVMSASGAGAKRLPQAPSSGRPSWTRDSKSILFPSGGTFVKVDARTGRVKTRYSVRLDLSVAQAASVSPDGKTFTFVGPRAPTGGPDCGESFCPQYALYVAASSTGHRRRVAKDAGAGGWSADSKELVYVANGKLTIDVVASGKKRTLSTGAHVAQADAPPAWQPR